MRIVTAIFLTMFASSAAASDPAAALSKAKEEITAGNDTAALQRLREAMADAASLTDLQQRRAALSAIHFYSALALSNLGEKELAASELRSFLFYSSGSTIEASRYPPDFVRLFEDVSRGVTTARSRPASFDDAYPGYPPAVSSSSWPVETWGASSEFIILATDEEKEQWGRLQDNEVRRAFIHAFWAARDPDSSTGMNEARIELLQRIAFADIAFQESMDDRGSLSDRGRVFVLLGPPRRVSIRPLTRSEAWWKPHRTIDTGNAMEEWTYFRDQLPKKLPNNEVTFRFISDGGMLARKMQRDFLAEKAFRDAPRALIRDE